MFQRNLQYTVLTFWLTALIRHCSHRTLVSANDTILVTEYLFCLIIIKFETCKHVVLMIILSVSERPMSPHCFQLLVHHPVRWEVDHSPSYRMSGALPSLYLYVFSYRTYCNAFSCCIVPKLCMFFVCGFAVCPKKSMLPTDNKAKVYYGLLKEPDIQYLPVEEEEDGEGDSTDKPKKKKAKKDPLFSKKTKSDPNAPPVDRIPLPDLKDADKLEKVKALREASKRVTLGPETLPSICFYTLLNSAGVVTSAEVSEDSSLLAVGFTDSIIKVWTLVPQKLRAMKSAEQLQDIDREADDVLVRMMDDRSAETSRILHGHNGPVYRVAFSPDRMLLLSCSEDTTVRLWSLQTWTCLVCYKGHIFPVWDVRFAPHGYYFATAGHDKTARLWATDQHQPLRIFAGHFSDVDCIQFHPNSNYVATGSSDRTVRLWDCLTGNHVRLMTGHKAPVYALCFSVEGRFLASAGADSRVLMWDLAHGHLLAELTGHKGPIHTLAFSRDGHILTSGSQDCSVKLWDFSRLAEEMVLEDVNVSHNPDIKKSDSYLLRSYGTKNSHLLHLHFTRRNVLLAVGMYEGS